MKEYRFALVGATGLVGLTSIKVLEEYNLPLSKIVFFASSRSSGSKIKYKDYIVQELKENSFDEGFDFAILSAGDDVAKYFARAKKYNRFRKWIKRN